MLKNTVVTLSPGRDKITVEMNFTVVLDREDLLRKIYELGGFEQHLPGHIIHEAKTGARLPGHERDLGVRELAAHLLIHACRESYPEEFAYAKALRSRWEKSPSDEQA